jgi:predicted dehydrogenase
MPQQVQAQVSLGKYHHIEVEDEVSAIFQWAPKRKGDPPATGVFVTSTGECPGTDRLEIVGDTGKIVVENGNISFTQTGVSVSKFSRTTDEAFGQPPMDKMQIDVDQSDPGHYSVTSNFIEAIRKPKTPLICSGEDAIHELELGNAMLMSGLTGKTVKLPMNRAAFYKKIQHLASSSKFKKGATRKAKVDMAKSFH